MMDPFTALGVAGNIVQFIDFSLRILAQTREIRRLGSTSSNKTLEDLTQDLANLSGSLQATEPSRIGKPTDSSADEQALRKIAEECSFAAQDLLSCLRGIKVLDKKKPTALHHVAAAIEQEWKKDKVREMAEQLNSYRQQLALRTLCLLNATAEKQSSDVNDGLQNLDHKGDDIIEAVSISRKMDARAAAENRMFHKRTHKQLDRVIAAFLTHRDGRITTISQPHSLQPDTLQFADAPSRILGGNVMRIHQDYGSDGEDSVPQVSMRDLESFQRQIMQSLSFRRIRDREEEVVFAHRNTLEWVFRDPVPSQKPWADMMKWLRTGKGCYWINGKAGSGKSTLMKHIYNDRRTHDALSEWAGEQHLIVVSFFFWNLGSTLQKSHIGLLRSVLHDILLQVPELLPNVLPTLCQAASRDEDLEPSSAQMKKGLEKLIRETQQSHKICLLIDGIDEFDGDHAEMSEYFVSLSSSPSLKILVSSRPIQACVYIFTDFPNLRLEDMTHDDVSSYTKDIVGSHRRWCELIHEEGMQATELTREIVEKASGVFLWVVLAVASLLEGLRNHDRIADLRWRLRALPADLETLYNHMLGRLQPLYQQHASELLQIVFQHVDMEIELHLTALQLSFADEQGPEYAVCHPQGPLSISQMTSRCKAVEARLRSRCCGLVELWQDWRIDEPERLVQSRVMFLHRTVVEFLRGSAVWSRTLEITRGTGFDPNVALAAGFLVDVKTSLVLGEEQPSLLSMRRCLNFCRAAEGSTRQPQTQIVDELDLVLKHHRESNLPKPSSFDNLTKKTCWGDSDWVASELRRPSRLQNVKEILVSECSLFVLAATTGQALYIKEKCIRVTSIASSLQGQQAMLAVLHCASCILFDHVNIGHYHDPDSPSEERRASMRIYRQITQALLESGGDPNQKATERDSSPWMLALRATQRLLVVSGAPRRDIKVTEVVIEWADILQLLLLHGADPNGYAVSPKSDIQRTPALSIINSIGHVWSSAVPEITSAFEQLKRSLVGRGAVWRHERLYPPVSREQRKSPDREVTTPTLSPRPSGDAPDHQRNGEEAPFESPTKTASSRKRRPLFLFREWRSKHV